MQSQDKPRDPDELLSIPDFMDEELPVSRSNIYALIKKGAIRPTKIGGRTFIRRGERDRLIAAGTVA